MLRLCTTGLIALLAGTLFPAAAFSSSLQDWEFNVNGTDYYPSGGATLGSVPGLASASFNSTSGLGTLTLTFDPAKAGSYYLGAFFFIPVGVPFYNENGVVNGSPVTGQTWQIDVPEYDVGSSNHGAGTIVDNLASEKLNDTNTVPGNTSNYLYNCGANGGGAVTASCNDFVSMAEGFKFSLTANQEEVLTLVLGTSNPGGFSLEAVHPIDGSNPSASDVYFSESGKTVCTVNCGGGPPPPPTVPEPASWGLLTTAGAVLALAGRRWKSRV